MVQIEPNTGYIFITRRESLRMKNLPKFFKKNLSDFSPKEEVLLNLLLTEQRHQRADLQEIKRQLKDVILTVIEHGNINSNRTDTSGHNTVRHAEELPYDGDEIPEGSGIEGESERNLSGNQSGVHHWTLRMEVP